MKKPFITTDPKHSYFKAARRRVIDARDAVERSVALSEYLKLISPTVNIA